MTALTMHLFPDGREKDERVLELNDRIRRLPRGRAREGRLKTFGLSTAFYPLTWTAGYPRAWEGRFLGVRPDAILECARAADWHYPALVVYRVFGDDRWSHVLMGVSTPEDLRC